MVQTQLVDYISSQMKLGVSRDAIKSALVSAGWVAGDVEDTLKKIEGSAPAQVQPAAQPSAKPLQSSGMVTAKPASASPQMVRVSDLVSSPTGSSSMMSGSSISTSAAKPAAAKDSSKMDVSQFGGKISGNSFEATSSTVVSAGAASQKSGGSKKSSILAVVGALLILGLGGLCWYLYSNNSNLSAQVASLNNQSASVNSQLASLNTQFNASSSGLAAQIASLTAANQDLALNLSFFAVPIGTASTTAATPAPVTIMGLISMGGTKTYFVTTPRGSKIFIANSSVASMASQLKPLIGQTVQLTGTYVLGSDAMTVTSVVDLSPPAPQAATSTTASASSTTPAAASSTTPSGQE